MAATLHSRVLAGVLLPQSVLHSDWFAVLSTFVAINTVVYAAMACLNLLPRVYLSEWVSTRNRRSESRSIYPQEAVDPPQSRHIDAEVGGPSSDSAYAGDEEDLEANLIRGRRS
jgi:hypothetical protein